MEMCLIIGLERAAPLQTQGRLMVSEVGKSPLTQSPDQAGRGDRTGIRGDVSCHRIGAATI